MRTSRRLASLTFALAGLTLLFVSEPARADDVPKLAGNWTWTWKDRHGDEHRHILEIEGIGTKLAARERFDDLEPVRVADFKVDRKSIRFSVVRGEKRSDYRGVVADANTINGTVEVTVEGETTEFVWKAKRQPTKENPIPD